ncbi:17789_t:CDS:2, partial [Funneliformis geosporum]
NAMVNQSTASDEYRLLISRFRNVVKVFAQMYSLMNRQIGEAIMRADEDSTAFVSLSAASFAESPKYSDISDSSLYLLNCDITVLKSVYILIWQFGGETKIAVKTAANSAVEGEENNAANAEEYDNNSVEVEELKFDLSSKRYSAVSVEAQI